MENLVLNKDVQNLCLEIHSQFITNKLNGLIKEFIHIYIKYFAHTNNLHVSKFINSRLDVIKTSEIQEKIICELYVFLTLLTSHDSECIENMNNNYTQNIDDWIIDFESFVVVRDYSTSEKCMKEILKLKDDLCDERLLIKSNSIDEKYQRDGVWWLWFKMYNLMKTDNRKLEESLVYENFKIFKYDYNKTIRNKRTPLLKVVLYSLCMTSKVYEQEIYDKILIQIMLKINLLYPISKHSCMYKNYLFTCPEKVEPTNEKSISFDKIITETKDIMIDHSVKKQKVNYEINKKCVVNK